MDAIVLGNVTLDILCYPINEVPRHESISFDDVIVSPGGCASNTAIGLAAMGIKTGLVARTGDDDAADLLYKYWEKVGIDSQYIQRVQDSSTGTSIGLIDDHFQPRFIHTPGSNSSVSADIIDPPAYAESGIQFFHLAGFFVLPNLFEQVGEKFKEIRNLGINTSMDVVFNVRMDDPKLRQAFWAAIPHLDYFTANAYEAFRLTGEEDYQKAAARLKEKGARNIIIKLGAEGCYALSESFSGIIPGNQVDVIDTTGAGDAFASGLIAGLFQDKKIYEACQLGNQAGAKICTKLGAVAAWFENK